MEKEDYNVSDIYQGGYSTFDSSQNLSPVNHPISTERMGLTTDPRNADVLKEASAKLSTGVKHIEIEGVIPKVFESIPQQHLKELNRLSKLTGVEMSLHGPVVDSAGISEQGFSEQNRQISERRFIQTIERSHDINPEGNIIVNFHTSEGIPSSEYEITPEGKKARKLFVVNKESGKLYAPLEPETKYYPDSKELKQETIKKFQKGEIIPTDITRKDFKQIPLGEGEVLSPERRLDILNNSEWDTSINQIIFNKERADEILQKNSMQIQHLQKQLDNQTISQETLKRFPEQKQAYDHYQNAKVYLDDTYMQLQSLFSKGYEFGDRNQKKALKVLSNNFVKELNQDETIVGRSRAMQTLLQGLKQQGMAPEMYVPIEEFAIEKASRTFGNTAFESYKKFGETAPIVNIENPPAGTALSTGEELKAVIEESRKQFIERAKKEGISESEARKQSEKLIGATWDIGHINMLRKQGATKEDIIRETEAVKKLVTHVHLSDNFGFEHTELPMGMGNVPTKEIMEKLGKQGFEAKKIIEAADWWQHFKTPPVQQTLEALGSPIYSMQMSPYWNQVTGFQQNYFSGYGEMLPSVNYETFGAGFSQLPSELGGQKPGAQGARMSGRPME